ncbi:MAG: hypothetical protein AB8C02_09450, partial [Halioglobus sp.]
MRTNTISQCLAGMSLAAAVFLVGCSDGSSNGPPPPPPVPPAPPLASIATPNADRCEILDSENCLLPFPSSVFTVTDDAMETGKRVNLPTLSMPANKQGVNVDTSEWNRNDGFSPSQMLVAYIPGLDLVETGAPLITDIARSLEADSPVVVIRASTGEQHLIFAELDANTDEATEKTFLIRPMVQFERGERYIVALRNLRGSDGELLEVPEVFGALRDSTLTDNDAIEARRPAMDAMFDELEDAGVAREEL